MWDTDGRLMHPDERPVDPVCGMRVDPGAPRGGTFDHAGVTYYFCSPGCRTKFAGILKGG